MDLDKTPHYNHMLPLVLRVTFPIVFQIADTVIDDLDLFFVHAGSFFNGVHPLDEVIVFFHLHFQHFDAVFRHLAACDDSCKRTDHRAALCDQRTDD